MSQWILTLAQAAVHLVRDAAEDINLPEDGTAIPQLHHTQLDPAPHQCLCATPTAAAQ
jgi:hypothetical protein